MKDFFTQTRVRTKNGVTKTEKVTYDNHLRKIVHSEVDYSLDGVMTHCSMVTYSDTDKHFFGMVEDCIVSNDKQALTLFRKLKELHNKGSRDE